MTLHEVYCEFFLLLCEPRRKLGTPLEMAGTHTTAIRTRQYDDRYRYPPARVEFLASAYQKLTHSWSSRKIRFRSIGVISTNRKHWDSKRCYSSSSVPGPAAPFSQTSAFFESELSRSKSVMPSRYRHLRGCLDPKICTKV